MIAAYFWLISKPRLFEDPLEEARFIYYKAMFSSYIICFSAFAIALKAFPMIILYQLAIPTIVLADFFKSRWAEREINITDFLPAQVARGGYKTRKACFYVTDPFDSKNYMLCSKAVKGATQLQSVFLSKSGKLWGISCEEKIEPTQYNAIAEDPNANYSMLQIYTTKRGGASLSRNLAREACS